MSEELNFELISFKLQYMHSELIKAGLPVVSVRMDKTIEWETPPTAQQITQATTILNNINLNTLTDLDKANIIAEYQIAITRLDQIQNAVNPTNAQVIAAVKDLAKYQLLLLKFLKRILV